MLQSILKANKRKVLKILFFASLCPCVFALSCSLRYVFLYVLALKVCKIGSTSYNFLTAECLISRDQRHC